MTITILDVTTLDVDFVPPSRTAIIEITDGVDTYKWSVGGLPIIGDLQPLLDAREAELWAKAQARAEPVNIYDVTPKQIVKALALVMLDEVNALRTAAGLQPRTGAQLLAAIKGKLGG